MKKSLAAAEWRAIFTNKKLLIPLLAVMVIPVLYSGMFLWAFWDPYDRLEDLPVAVINNDTGADFEGTSLHLGDELVKKLKDNDQFSFDIVSKEKGHKDLDRRKYYLLVEIPKDFSQNATTLLDEHPKKLELIYTPNESHNFLSAQIGETAMKEIKSALTKEVTATYSETIFDKVKEMADGFETASEGAGKLHDGSGELASGSETLKENLDLLASKSVEFKNGVSQAEAGTDELAAGAGALSSGLDQLAAGHKQIVEGAAAAANGSGKLASGAEELNAGLKQADGSMETIVAGTKGLKDGASQLAGKLKEFQAGAGQVAKGAEDLQAGIKQMEKQVGSIDTMLADLPLPDEAKAQLAGQLKGQLQAGLSQLEEGSKSLAAGTGNLQTASGELQAGAGTLAEKTGELLAGQQQMKAGLGKLSVGSDQLLSGIGALQSGQADLLAGVNVFDQKLLEAKGGANQLAAGSTELKSGMGALSSGSEQLSDGSHELAEGSTALTEGTKKLEDGTAELKDKLADAAEQSGSVQANDETFDMMGDPVKVENKPIHKVPNYGTGFAPYFLSLGLFVGALLLSIVFPLREPAGRPRNGFSWFLAKFGVIGIVGVLQSLLAVAIMLFGLKIEVQSVPLFILTTLITSLSFIALIQFLVTLLGDPGRFIAIIVLILQLTTSAGTFPLELIPKALQPVSAALPMTYSVQAYKAAISSGDFSFMWQNVGILAAYAVAFMALTLGFFMAKFKRDYAGKEA